MPKCKDAPSTDKRCKYINPDTKIQCSREALAHELCWSHYQQERRGRPLTPIRPRDLKLLPGNVRVAYTTAAVLNLRVEDKKARSVYEATRQAIDIGVSQWTKKATAEEHARIEKKAATMVAEDKEKKAKAG
jgi:hypothetical protein